MKATIERRRRREPDRRIADASGGCRTVARRRRRARRWRERSPTTGIATACATSAISEQEGPALSDCSIFGLTGRPVRPAFVAGSEARRRLRGRPRLIPLEADQRRSAASVTTATSSASAAPRSRGCVPQISSAAQHLVRCGCCSASRNCRNAAPVSSRSSQPLLRQHGLPFARSAPCARRVPSAVSRSASVSPGGATTPRQLARSSAMPCSRSVGASIARDARRRRHREHRAACRLRSVRRTRRSR